MAVERGSSRNNDVSSLKEKEEEEVLVARWRAVLMVTMRFWDELSIDFQWNSLIKNNWLPTDGPTDRRTNGPTDQQTDGATDGQTFL